MTKTASAVPRVVVVGGGPVGLTTALELAHHGIACAVVEPRISVDHSRPRAKTTSVRSMELFRRLGVADAIRARAPLAADWCDEIRFCVTATGAEVTRLTDVLGLRLAGSPLVAESAQQIAQPDLEEVLREHVAADPLITSFFGARADEVHLRDDGVRIALIGADGSHDELEADYVVGADGARSVVRSALGAGYEVAAAGRPNVNMTFRSRSLAALLPERPALHHWVLHPDEPGVIGPLDQDGTWWAIATGAAAIDDDEDAIRHVRGLVGAAVDVEIIATDPWRARTALATSYGHGRAYIVGDAAHQNPPWGGHGFNTGVGDAVNLGWKLAAVLEGWAPRELLDSYGAERRPVAERTIALAAANLAALSIDLSHDALLATGARFEAARRVAEPAIRAAKAPEFHSLGLVLGAGYGPTSGEQAPDEGIYRPIAAAGNRLPHERDADGRSLYDLLDPAFTVVGDAHRARSLLDAARSHGVPVGHVSLVEHGFRDAEPDDLLLVRPDQHLAWVGTESDDPDRVLDAALRGFVPDAPAPAPTPGT